LSAGLPQAVSRAVAIRSGARARIMPPPYPVPGVV
jgi:hypothetical protein